MGSFVILALSDIEKARTPFGPDQEEEASS